ncbi:SLAC1 anion channel family protein [Guyparkeria sp.]|uniref:SLAC1 anion channel family protein n=1 Tax=Guyparkeria sp. TaxID=2035736 RepID=UPI003970A7C6
MQTDRLKHFPISMFAIVMGLVGVTLVIDAIATPGTWLAAAGGVLLVVDFLVYGSIAAIYLLKARRHPGEVMAEFNHPVKLSFFPAITIGLILLAMASLPRWPDLAHLLWWIGSVGHIVLTLSILSRWMHQGHFEIHHSNPAWFIPIVGNILVPIAGVPLGHAEVSWFFFSIGLVFWPVLFAILLYRYFFHAPMPGKLMPTLFILIAPPAVGFLSWLALHPGASPDGFALILFNFGLFLGLLLLWQAGKFIRLPFALSWWAYSFPVAALTLATIRMGEISGNPFWSGLGVLLALVTVLLVAGLVGRTLVAVKRGEVCQPE